MNQPATAQTPAALAERMAALTFKTLLAMVTEAKGGPLGFDPNRGPSGAWQGGDLKPKLAGWAVETISNTALWALLPKYEDKATYNRKWVAQNKGKTYNPAPKPQAIPMESPKPAPAPVARPQDEPKAVTPKADEGTTVARVREIAREEAAELDDALRAAIARTLAANVNATNEVFAQVANEIGALKAAQGITVVIHNTETGKVDTTKLPRQHKQFTRLLNRCAVKDKDGNRLNLWIAGPAGSGKTSAAMSVAKALNLPFRFSGAVRDEFKLIGFTDATGKTVRTSFREIWEHGGVFLKDECDGSDEAALLTLNAALANGWCDFPDGCIKRHPDCIIIAAANTWGNGATHEYVGRTKLDAATMDRFVRIAWDYDTEMELDTCANRAWAEQVQRYRNNARAAGVHCVISPRASYTGAALLAAGAPEAEVIEELVTPGMTPENVAKVLGRSRY